MTSNTHIKTSIIICILFQFYLQSISLAQVGDLFRNPSIQYHDSLIVVDHDSIWTICGNNPELNLSFIFRVMSEDIHYMKESSKQSKVDLYNTYSDYSYLAKLPDTTYWKSFNEPMLGIFFRCPPDIRPIADTENHTINFSQLSDSSLCLRFSITSKSFAQEAISRGWIPKYSEQWLVFDHDPYDEGLHDVAYLEGKDWKCLTATELNVFYDENTGKGYSDKLKFFAMKIIDKSTSLILEITCESTDIFEDELITMLSSISFKK